MNRTLITSALPYANGYLHLGHCAGAYLPADIYTRWLRLCGEEVLYVCGSDEHGVAITIAAEQNKVSPEEIIDKYHIANRDAFEKFGMSFDIYHRTSMPLHHTLAKEFFEDFLKKNYLSEKEEEQFYDSKANMFLPDRYVEGTCPNCGFDRARGDQCDSCGAYYNQLDLKNPKSLITGLPPEIKKTTHWYMRFDLFQEFLENYINSHSKDWKDNVLQQSFSWLKQGLSERAITRDLSWGVQIEDIDGINKEKAKGKVLYVWFDAVLGYITATKVWASIQERNGLGKKEDWKKWWQDPDTRYLAFIGKDNIVFHTLIFPAMLHGRGDNYILPENVPANEFLNLEGQKFSKSRNWSIDLRDFINDFPNQDSIDALRYTLTVNLPESKDSDFTWKDFQARNNNELSAIFGNFINRTLQFVQKNFNNEVPTLADKFKTLPNIWKQLLSQLKNIKSKEEAFEIINSNNILESNNNSILNNIDSELLINIILAFNGIRDNYNKFRFRDALSETMNIARAANKYFNDSQPWVTFKSDKDECGKALYICLQLCRTLSVVFSPVVPYASQRLNNMLNIEANCGNKDYNSQRQNYWDAALEFNLHEGWQLGTAQLLFSRIEDEVVQAQISKLGDLTSQVNNIPEKEPDVLINYDEFSKIKLKTAKIIEAERIKKSKKLIKLQVEIGQEKRQIVAGIGEYYTPEQLINKLVVVVTNLLPAKLMGEESNGMLLAANSDDGKLCIITPELQDFQSGAEVR